MSYENLVPGVYKAKIVDWAVQEVPQLKQLKAVIKFQIKDGINIKWDGLFLKKDGSVSKKTVDTLKACGFAGKDVSELTSATALDTTKELSITVIKDGEYWKVEWVNAGDGELKKVSDVKVIKGYDLRKVNSALALGAKPAVKNYADDLEKDDLPF